MVKMKNRILSFILLMTVAVSSFSVSAFADAISNKSVGDTIYTEQYSDEVEQAGDFLKDILALIDQKYVGDVSVKDLVKGAISGMTEKLDKYSQFLEEDEFNALIQDTTNTNVGIGISYYEKFENGYPLITNVYEGSPAEKAGIVKNDVLKSVDGVDVKNKTGEEITSIITAKTGQTIKVVIERNGTSKELSVTIGNFITPTVFVSKLQTLETGLNLDNTKADKVRYIQISQFDDATGEEFKKVVADLKKQNVEGIIIDLRFNGGGVTQAAYEMCEALVKEGPFLNIRTKDGNYTVNSEDKDVPFKNIAVLINGATASASELVTAVLKDNGADIIGEKSYGKGVTQAIMQLTNLGALKLTVEEFSPMSGRKINESGVLPNYEVKQIALITTEEDDIDKALENALKQLGYDVETNEKKVAVIKELQKKYNLTQTGQITNETIGAINSEIVAANYKNDTVLNKAIEVIFNKMK